MKMATRVRPLSYLKAHASEILRGLGEDGSPLVITVNGEAKAVLQDIHGYEQTQETLALLKILALGQQQVSNGEVVPLDAAVARVKARRRRGE